MKFIKIAGIDHEFEKKISKDGEEFLKQFTISSRLYIVFFPDNWENGGNISFSHPYALFFSLIPTCSSLGN